MWTIYQQNSINIGLRLGSRVFDDEKEIAGKMNVTTGSQHQYYSKVDCYPLLTPLLAANMTTIDFMRLDVEGFEIKILRTIPWDSVKIMVTATQHIPYVHTFL